VIVNRKVLAAVITIFLTIALPGWAYGAAVFNIGSATFSVGGSEQDMDVAPYIDNGRTYLPVRYAAESVGVAADDIAWNPATRQVLITTGERSIVLTVGSEALILDGTAVSMDAAPEIDSGRAMLPVRFLAQALDVDISWDATARTVTIGELVMPVSAQPDSPTVVPALCYDPAVQTVARDFAWQYQGRTFTWHIEAPSDLLDWDRDVNQLTEKYYSGQYAQGTLLESEPEQITKLVQADSAQEGGDLTPWVDEGDNSQWSGYLANRLARCASSNGFDYFHTAEFIQSFVGGAIPYQLTDVPELPGQTMIDNGDCKDKSVLLAAILKSLFYKVVLLEFAPGSGETAGHMAVGVAIGDSQTPQGTALSYFRSGGLKYYFAETTAPGWTLGAASEKEPAQVYDVN
jgi:hypothetical protein